MAFMFPLASELILGAETALFGNMISHGAHNMQTIAKEALKNKVKNEVKDKINKYTHSYKSQHLHNKLHNLKNKFHK